MTLTAAGFNDVACRRLAGGRVSRWLHRPGTAPFVLAVHGSAEMRVAIALHAYPAHGRSRDPRPADHLWRHRTHRRHARAGVDDGWPQGRPRCPRRLDVSGEPAVRVAGQELAIDARHAAQYPMPRAGGADGAAGRDPQFFTARLSVAAPSRQAARRHVVPARAQPADRGPCQPARRARHFDVHRLQRVHRRARSSRRRSLAGYSKFCRHQPIDVSANRRRTTRHWSFSAASSASRAPTSPSRSRGAVACAL